MLITEDVYYLAYSNIQHIQCLLFHEDAPELLEGLMMGVCRVRMSLNGDVDFFFFILYLLGYVFNPNICSPWNPV